MLKLDDETFLDSHPPIPQAKTLPAITDTVTVYDCPTGGTEASPDVMAIWNAKTSVR